MEHSDSIGNLAKALAAAQGEMKPAALNSVNPFLKNKYADLGAVIEAVRQPMAKHGLSWSQHPTLTENGIDVETFILHESGEWMSSNISLPFGEERGKSSAQVAGSIITYLRRYALSSIFGVYADEDTDGNGNGQPKQPQAQAKSAAYKEMIEQVAQERGGVVSEPPPDDGWQDIADQPTPPAGVIMATEKQVAAIHAIMKASLQDGEEVKFRSWMADKFGVGHVNELSKAQAMQVIDTLKRREAAKQQAPAAA